MDLRPLLALCAALGASACVPAGRPPARLEPVPAPTRAQVIRHALPQNVRLVVLDRGEPVRSGSGVVLGVRRGEGGPRSFVVTNAHVVAARDGERLGYRVFVESGGRPVREHPATLLASGEVPDLDLALLEVAGAELPAAMLAPDAQAEVGADVFVVGAPYGRALSVSAGLLSRVEREAAGQGAPTALKTDAAVGYGASGGGVFCAHTGQLLGIVEGYRTAKVTLPVGGQSYSFDVPMPGETFAAPAAKLRRFLRERGFGQLLAESARGASAEAG